MPTSDFYNIQKQPLSISHLWELSPHGGSRSVVVFVTRIPCSIAYDDLVCFTGCHSGFTAAVC